MLSDTLCIEPRITMMNVPGSVYGGKAARHGLHTDRLCLELYMINRLLVRNRRMPTTKDIFHVQRRNMETRVLRKGW